MTAGENIESTPTLLGVTLPQYAAIQAGLTEGHEIEILLEREGLHAASWAAAEGGWSEAILDDFGRGGHLQNEYDQHLAEAQDRYSRRVPPLDEDLRAWLDFVRRWAADPEPLALLNRLGLGSSDVIRLHRKWSLRLADDPVLTQSAKEILNENPGELPVPRPEPIVLPPAVAGGRAVRSIAPSSPLNAVTSLTEVSAENDLPQMFSELPQGTPKETTAAAPAPSSILQPHSSSHAAIDETLPGVVSPLPRFVAGIDPDLPFAKKDATPLIVDQPILHRPPPQSNVKKPASEHTTGEFSTSLFAPALPFVNTKGDPSSMTPSGAVSARLPPSQPLAGAVTLTLAQYAALCAELAIVPASSEQTFLRYGLGAVQDRLSTDSSWKERLRRNPSEYQDWQRLYQEYCVYFTELARRGAPR